MSPLERLAGAVDAVLAIDPATTHVDALGDGIVALERQLDRLQTAKATLLGAFDQRGGWRDAGHFDLAGWLTATLRKAPSRATIEQSTARALNDLLPATRQAVLAGEATFDDAQAIAATTRTAARQSADTATVRKVGQQRAAQIDARAATRDTKAAYEGRHLTLHDERGGGGGRFSLHQYGIEMLRTALAPLARKRGADDCPVSRS